MKIRIVLTFIFLIFPFFSWAVDTIPAISIPSTFPKINSTKKHIDSLQKKSTKNDTIVIKPIEQISNADSDSKQNTHKTKENTIDTVLHYNKWQKHKPITLDSMTFQRNPLFNELVYMGKSIDISQKEPDFHLLYFGNKSRSLFEPVDLITVEHPLITLKELRSDAKDYITKHDFSLYKTTAEKLPELTWNRYEFIKDSYNELSLEVNKPSLENISSKNLIKNKKPRYWRARLNGSLQFSENYISENWHKGGYNNLAILGILDGTLNFNNNKKIKWENSLEWRSGVNAIKDSDTTWIMVPNEDMLRAISNFGVKATGNFYYSSRAEFQTQFFNSPKSLNSTELKARFLTPIRLTLGVGMKYQYKVLSVELSPLTYEYIYLHDTIPTPNGENIDFNAFGIEKGKNKSKKWGSELNVVLKDYFPVDELRLNSNFRFFTNYQSVVIDWEIIAEFRVNRFLSTRLLINPRYDNSVILEGKEKNKIQMKQMLSFGLSFRFY